MRQKKSQSLFDYALAFIALAGLVVGIVRVWVWFNANYGKRQLAYQNSRLVAAGRSNRVNPDAAYTAPVDIGATSANEGNIYQPLALTQNWVFSGQASGGVGAASAAGAYGTTGLTDCDATCATQCAAESGCTDAAGDPNTLCQCHQSCYAKCNCENQVSALAALYAQQVTEICGTDNDCSLCDTGVCSSQGQAACGTACSMRWSAGRMRDAANKCDDWWEGPCNWFGGGKAAKKLKAGAKDLDRMAWQLEMTAGLASRSSQRLQACCDETSEALINLCLEEVQIANQCDSDCVEGAISYFYDCVNGGGSDSPCYALADLNRVVCYTSCTSSAAAPCSERVSTLTSSLNEQIATYEDSIEANEDTIEEITNVLTQAASTAAATCSETCANTNDSSCYSNCYATQRDNYCKANCCKGVEGGSQRACDEPSEDCDTCEEQGESCPKCGLSKLAETITAENEDMQDQIDKIKQAITSLSGCCSASSDAAAQNTCMENIINGIG